MLHGWNGNPLFRSSGYYSVGRLPPLIHDSSVSSEVKQIAQKVKCLGTLEKHK